MKKTICKTCNGEGRLIKGFNSKLCTDCDGFGYIEEDNKMKDFVTKFLDSKGITWKIQDGKIIISSEFQEDHYDKELDMKVPYFLTEWNYDASLNEELSDFNDVLDEKYGIIFECEWPGTFSLIIE